MLQGKENKCLWGLLKVKAMSRWRNLERKKSLVSSWEGPFFLWNIQMGRVFLSKMKEDAFVSSKQKDDRLWDKPKRDLQVYHVTPWWWWLRVSFKNVWEWLHMWLGIMDYGFLCKNGLSCLHMCIGNKPLFYCLLIIRTWAHLCKGCYNGIS
jgi:hypothetical protein